MTVSIEVNEPRVWKATSTSAPCKSNFISLLTQLLVHGIINYIRTSICNLFRITGTKPLKRMDYLKRQYHLKFYILILENVLEYKHYLVKFLLLFPSINTLISICSLIGLHFLH